MSDDDESTPPTPMRSNAEAEAVIRALQNCALSMHAVANRIGEQTMEIRRWGLSVRACTAIAATYRGVAADAARVADLIDPTPKNGSPL